MDERLQRRVQRYGWDKAAGYYEQYWQQQLAPAQRRLLQLANCKRGERVVDIACGTGLLSFPIVKQVGDSGYLLGTDISDKMVEICRTIAEVNDISNAEFERMEAEELKIDEGEYDVAICSLGLMYVTDGQQSVNELFRVLKPGGRAAVLVWGQRNNCGWADIFPIVDARVTSEVCPLFFRLGTGDVLKQVFQHSGFVNLEVEKMQTLLHYNSADEAIGAAFIGGPVALAYNRFTEQVKQEAHEEYLLSIDKYKEGNEYNIPGEFVIVVGHK